MKIQVLLFCTFLYSASTAQHPGKRVLFLGNSYTQSNNLPRMIADAAASAGDTLQYDSHTPGGYTLREHSTHPTSLLKIAAGNFDYLVLQEQSQLPSFPDNEVENYVFSYARILDSISKARNPCTQTVFYMTWGRKDGDASNCSFWPPVCTYEGMDSLLHLRYRQMANRNNAIVSPVGAVWKYLRQQAPQINLYVSDGSHPSVAGTYAAACSFYSVFFRKDPTVITYHAGLPPADAVTIREAAKRVVFDSLLKWQVGTFDPVADFTHTVSGNLQITCTNQSLRSTNFHWDFGDGNTSSGRDPVHTYAGAGTYTVKLIAGSCGRLDSVQQTVIIRAPVDTLRESPAPLLTVYPNPAGSRLQIEAAPSLRGAAYALFDHAGRLVMKGTITAAQMVIDIARLAGGLYTLRVQGSTGKAVRLLKQ